MPRKKKAVIKRVEGAYSRLTPKKKAVVDEAILKFHIYLETRRGLTDEDELEIIRRVTHVEYSGRDRVNVDSVDIAVLLEPA